ncbi:MAG: type II toxin-antitoxin system RelE/ParE family toxin [Gammaproteobacteria bacterium]|nr:type II toxin-antitoxin system RelE/ParE family toxin [Gammaproteobacteria bacterium]MBL4729726.1 type II toxin-antitoxin system RelE/ParE family toxin [Gammaproteobacteria bacterium]
MTYSLVFKLPAKREWDKLNSSVRDQFKKKLAERLINPRVEGSRLRGLRNCYKIKLRSAAYRLVYQVKDDLMIVSVISVGKRERNAAYRSAAKRL